LIPNLISCLSDYYRENDEMGGTLEPLALRVAILAVPAETVMLVAGLDFLAV